MTFVIFLLKYYPPYVLFMIPFVWTLFVAVMNMQRVRDLPQGIHGVVHLMGMMVYGIGLVADIVGNFTVIPFVLFTIPRVWKGDFTITATLSRIAFADNHGWRWVIAWWMEYNMLGPYTQTGKHLSPPRA